MKQTRIILLDSDDRVVWETTMWLEYAPDYLFYDDGVYERHSGHLDVNVLTYTYAGNALSL